MTTRPLRTRTPSRSGATPRTATRADASAAPTLPKAAAARLARLEAANMPWLGQGDEAMLVGYGGQEVSGPAEYPTDPKQRS